MRRIYCNVPDKTACSAYRALLPHKHCAPMLEKEGISLEVPDNLNISEPYDVYIFHRFLNAQFLPYLFKLKERGARIVWEVDDNLRAIPTSNPASKIFQPHDFQCLELCFELCDDIIVTTETLRQAIGHPEKTTVLPNLVDLDEWTDWSHLHGDDQHLRILWAGSPTHEKDLELVVPAIREYLELPEAQNTQFVFYGMAPPRLASSRQVTILPMTPLDCYNDLITLIRPQIALCPIADHPFNESKSAIKWMEMTLAGAAVIASNRGPYRETIRHESTGLLVEDGGWLEALIRLTQMPQIARRLAANARADVRCYHSWQSLEKNLWLDFFRQIAR